jgi:hypothetical protein
MPSMTMGTQTGNSCAAHCIVIGIAELFNTRNNMTPGYAENTVWPQIKFLVGENGGATDILAGMNNSDPRKIVTFVNATGGGEAAAATLLCDSVLKSGALTYVDVGMQPQLDGLFNMMKGGNSTVTTAIKPGVYYNCSFLMFAAAAPGPASYRGMHNILVTNSGGSIWYYNSNETNPAWVNVGPGAAWMRLNNQNGGNGSYVYTGVCVEMTAKV